MPAREVCRASCASPAHQPASPSGLRPEPPFHVFRFTFHVAKQESLPISVKDEAPFGCKLQTVNCKQKAEGRSWDTISPVRSSNVSAQAHASRIRERWSGNSGKVVGMNILRLFAIALVAVVALPAAAQRGMARGVGMAGARGGAPVRMAPSVYGFRAGGAFLPRGSGNRLIITNRPLGSFCRGCRSFRRGYYGYGYPYWGWAGADYWPIYDWDAGDYSYTPDSGYASADSFYAAQLQNELANQQEMNAQLAAQLSAERSRPAEGNAAASLPPQPARTAPEPESLETVLVFHDGSRTEIQNYAIVGPTLYEFGAHWTKKVALTDLDIPATVKANNDRGVEFVLPVQKGS